ncbi:MAG: hypothetical protein JWO31_2228 [Phycisphaerales bacterium]|nr:hypothetical protein [Phycisphaerales bacterium]
MASTRSLHLLPDVGPLRRTCRAIAALDAVLQPEREFRYFAYQKSWGGGRELASMRDGGGDEWFLVFGPAGALMKGFVHDAAMSEPVANGRPPWPGVTDAVPPALAAYLNDPALSPAEATFCVWREPADAEWRRGHVRFPPGPDPDGSEHLMAILDGDPVTYARWAEQHYEIEIPFIEVRRVYMHRPMTEEMARALNPQVDWAALVVELDQIGYPHAAT